MARILVIEDERELSTLVRQELRHVGHDVEAAFDGPSGVEAVERIDPDLIVLDVMLPGFDGLEVLRRVRATRATPILMLTARSTELDKVLGLELGADDYLTKPFSMRELIARVTAILRRVELIRSRSQASESVETISYPGLKIDVAGYKVHVEGQEVPLTATEFRLLKLLASNPGRVFSREYLLEEVWGGDVAVFDRTVDSHIQRLRKKLGTVGEMVETVWGVGYRFHGAAR
ncbi:MAG TPA: response regulator transcription factor [Thermomicrobiales bacterium]|nr:response regulator transcription factor [Thermomicrobiales bacterium]